MKETVIVVIVILMFSYVQCNSDNESDSKILKFVKNDSENGYDFEFQTSNGITRKETAIWKPTTHDESVLTVQGEFSFNFPDGSPVFVTFTADENGYRPKVQIGTRTGVVKDGTTVPPKMFQLGNRYNFDTRKEVSTSAIASIAGGGIGK